MSRERRHRQLAADVERDLGAHRRPSGRPPPPPGRRSRRRPRRSGPGAGSRPAPPSCPWCRRRRNCRSGRAAPRAAALVAPAALARATDSSSGSGRKTNFSRACPGEVEQLVAPCAARRRRVAVRGDHGREAGAVDVGVREADEEAGGQRAAALHPAAAHRLQLLVRIGVRALAHDVRQHRRAAPGRDGRAPRPSARAAARGRRAPPVSCLVDVRIGVVAGGHRRRQHHVVVDVGVHVVGDGDRRLRVDRADAARSARPRRPRSPPPPWRRAGRAGCRPSRPSGHRRRWPRRSPHRRRAARRPEGGACAAMEETTSAPASSATLRKPPKQVPVLRKKASARSPSQQLLAVAAEALARRGHGAEGVGLVREAGDQQAHRRRSGSGLRAPWCRREASLERGGARPMPRPTRRLPDYPRHDRRAPARGGGGRRRHARRRRQRAGRRAGLRADPGRGGPDDVRHRRHRHAAGLRPAHRHAPGLERPRHLPRRGDAGDVGEPVRGRVPGRLRLSREGRT